MSLKVKHRILPVGRAAAPRITASLALGVLCVTTSLGCRQRIADFTGISTKNIYAKGIDVSALPKAEGVTGADLGFLGIGTNIKDAVDRALEKGNGNLMIDCAIYMWSAPFVYGYEVRGTVIKVPYSTDSTTAQDCGS